MHNRPNACPWLPAQRTRDRRCQRVLGRISHVSATLRMCTCVYVASRPLFLLCLFFSGLFLFRGVPPPASGCRRTLGLRCEKLRSAQVLKGNAPALSLTCAGILSDMRGGLLEGPWNSSVWVLHCIGRSTFLFLASRRPRVMSEDTTIAVSLAHRGRGEKEKRSMGCRRAGLRFTGFPSWRDCGVSGEAPSPFREWEVC